MAVTAPVIERLTPVMVTEPALRPAAVVPTPSAPPEVTMPVTVTSPADARFTLPPWPLVLPEVLMAPVLRFWPATLLLTVMKPAVPPAPVLRAAPLRAVSAPVCIAPAVVLVTEIEPALPPAALPATPLPPLAVIAPLPVTPLVDVICMAAPLPPARSAPFPL